MSSSDSPDHPGLIFKIFRGPLFHKPVTGQELFFAVSYSELALAKNLAIDAICFLGKEIYTIIPL
jgi:hypothetical protein